MSDKPPEPVSPAAAPEEPRERSGFVPEFVRKAAVAGLGALFLTEEGLRSLAGQLKLPKEMMGYLASQAERTKDEITRILSEEARKFFQSDKLREEFVRLLQGMTLEVKAEVRLVPSPGEAEPPEGKRGSLRWP
jgi:hypothetical protein